MLARAQGGTGERAARLTPVIGDIALILIRSLADA